MKTPELFFKIFTEYIMGSSKGLTHCGLGMPYGVNTCSGNALLPDGTKPLPEPMMTFCRPP